MSERAPSNGEHTPTNRPAQEDIGRLTITDPDNKAIIARELLVEGRSTDELSDDRFHLSAEMRADDGEDEFTR